MNLLPIVSASGPMTLHSLRLRRGTDLMRAIKDLCREKHIAAGVVLSAVGCISRGRVRDAVGPSGGEGGGLHRFDGEVRVGLQKFRDEYCFLVLADLFKITSFLSDPDDFMQSVA